MTTKKILIAAMFPLLAVAQGVTGIVSGYVFDTQAKTIRPVNGLPGAASLGDPLNFGIPLSFDQVELTGQDVAYAAVDHHFFQLSLSASTATRVPGTLDGGRLVAPGLIWYRNSQQLQFISNGSFAVVASTGLLTAAGLDPVSGCAALAFDSGAIESVCGNIQTELYHDPSIRVTALAFASGATFALDAANNQVIQMSSQSSPSIAAGGFTKPVGMVAVNGSLLAIADAGIQQLTFVALNGSAQPAPIALLFAPTELRHLSNNILRLGKAGAAPFEVIDANQNNRNFFVPAMAPTTNTNSSKGVN